MKIKMKSRMMLILKSNKEMSKEIKFLLILKSSPKHLEENLKNFKINMRNIYHKQITKLKHRIKITMMMMKKENKLMIKMMEMKRKMKISINL
jgi:hypothetical protein